MNILLLEDDFGIGHILKKTLEKVGHHVVWTTSTEELRQIDDCSQIDVALLDVMLPGADGFEALKWLRNDYPAIGAIMLTARDAQADKIHGLVSGADDYVTKPFDTKELLARIDALYRKVAQVKGHLSVNHLEQMGLNEQNGTLEWKGQIIDLTQTEVAILACLMAKKNLVISRDDLLDAVWGTHFVGATKVVDVNIQRIRKKIGDEAILTKWGKGYQWNG